MRVEQFYNKNQFLILGGDAVVTLQSYNSIVANIDKKGNLNLGCNWNFSNTTLRHICLFLQDNIYLMDEYSKKLTEGILKSNNKKQYIQNLIDKEKIYIKNLD